MRKEKFGAKTQEALRDRFSPLSTSMELTPGQAIRIYREAQGLSQSQLSAKSGLRQTTISGLENSRINLGLDRAKILARALVIHPSALAFPSWNVKKESAA